MGNSVKKKKAFNPYLPGYVYVPDAEPRVFGERLYVFGSHDRSHGNFFCEEDYVCWSAPIDDLGNWRNEGIIYEKAQDPLNTNGEHNLYAPDVIQGPDGRYYLYYCLDVIGRIAVAVCDRPAGHYEYYGEVHYSDGRLLTDYFPADPAVLNDNGEIYLYYGFCPDMDIPGIHIEEKTGAHVVKLRADMLTVASGPDRILPYKEYTKNTGFEGHGFFEASSVRKFGERYYYIYASEQLNELCYAVSKYPDRAFQFGGIVISNGDIGYQGRKPEERLAYTGNIHGGLVEIDQQYYIFYHRHTQGTLFSRQGCAEPVFMNADGKIMQAEMTSAGLSGCLLEAQGRYPAMIACNMISRNGACDIPFDGIDKSANPYIDETYTYEGGSQTEQFICNMQDGDRITYKYFLFTGEEDHLEISSLKCGDLVHDNGKQRRTVKVCVRGNARGSLFLKQKGNEGRMAEFVLNVPGDDWIVMKTETEFETGKFAVEFMYSGEGRVDILWFSFGEV